MSNSELRFGMTPFAVFAAVTITFQAFYQEVQANPRHDPDASA